MPTELATKIKGLRKLVNLSQVQLSRRIAVTKKTVAEWEQSRQPASPERCLQLVRLAPPGPLRRWFIRHALERIGADAPLVLEALLGGPGRGTTQTRLPTTELRLISRADWTERLRAAKGVDPHVSVPLLSEPAAAGAARAVAEADIEAHALIPSAWCPNPANVTCVRARGDSMAPIVHDGAVVAIDHSQTDPMALHQKMVAVRYQQGVTIKWLECQRNRALRLVPENKKHPARTLPRSAKNPIIGLVTWWWNPPL
jgi:phage repressor protein C with HTH and peptisase S24 domain/DNA-binding XRE family transcriptional regulator